MDERQLVNLQDRIRLSYYRHRGNKFHVADELHIPVEEVEKVEKQLIAEENKDHKIRVANSFMKHVLMGHQQRIQRLEDLMHTLEGEDKSRVSLCCGAPVSVTVSDDGKTNIYTCLKCNGVNCNTTLKIQHGVIQKKQSIIRSLRDEDKHLIEFAEKMGYTNRDETPDTVIRNTQNILVVGKDGLTEDDVETIKEIENLTPKEREKIRKRIEQKILDVDSTTIDSDDEK